MRAKYGERFAKGGSIEGEWVIYNGDTHKLIGAGIYKSHRAAKTAFNKLWETGDYDNVGMQAKSEWDKTHKGLQEFSTGGIVTFVKDNDKYTKSWGRKGNKDDMQCVGAFDIKGWKGDYGYLYQLGKFDKNYYADLPLDTNEVLFRYESDATKIAKMMPVVKINIEKGLIYFLQDLYSEDDKNLKFEKRGIKPLFISLHEKVYEDLSKSKNYRMSSTFKVGGKIKKRKYGEK